MDKSVKNYTPDKHQCDQNTPLCTSDTKRPCVQCKNKLKYVEQQEKVHDMLSMACNIQ